ncbi:MAG: potassium channel family protein [Thiobacillus sp.]
MPFNFQLFLGLGGVPPHDSHLAQQWEKRLHWPMMAVTLLAIPAFYLAELTHEPHLRALGRMIDLGVLLAFSVELIIMLAVTAQKRRYLMRNWLSPVIIVATLLALLLPHLPSELSPLLRLLRLAIAGLLLARLVHHLRSLTPGSTPYILLFGFGLMLLSGAGFYWLEPTIHSYQDGVWLAFISGMTVGYGDLVPTTQSARLFAGIVIVLTYGVMSLVTASIAAFFIGQEEKRIRLEMHHDLKALRQEIAELREMLAKSRPPPAPREESDR